VIKSEFRSEKQGLTTIDEYVNKMRNRVSYLAKEETRIQQKNKNMSEMMQRREQVLLNKWEHQIKTNKSLLGMENHAEIKR